MNGAFSAPEIDRIVKWTYLRIQQRRKRDGVADSCLSAFCKKGTTTSQAPPLPVPAYEETQIQTPQLKPRSIIPSVEPEVLEVAHHEIHVETSRQLKLTVSEFQEAIASEFKQENIDMVDCSITVKIPGPEKSCEGIPSYLFPKDSTQMLLLNPVNDIRVHVKVNEHVLEAKMSAPGLKELIYQILNFDGLSVTIQNATTALTILEKALNYNILFTKALIHDPNIAVWCFNPDLAALGKMRQFQSQPVSVLIKKLKDLAMYDAFLTLCHSIRPIVQMQVHGIQVDLVKLRNLANQYTDRLVDLTTQTHKAAEKTFNIMSPLDVGDTLSSLGITITKVTAKKGQTSTAEAELKKIDHPLAELILEVRHVKKLHSAIDQLLTEATKQGTVRATWCLTGTSTGRLSCSNPNLQNIAKHMSGGDPDSYPIRECFVAPLGKTFVSGDYSQLELRIAAVLTKDETLIQKLSEGVDVHQEMACLVFQRESVSSAERDLCKRVCFGLLYGMGNTAMADQLPGVSLNDAKRYSDIFKAQYPKLSSLSSIVKEQIDQKGFVRSWSGRRRYLNPNEIRKAANTPIQGTAADVVLNAMNILHYTTLLKYDGVLVLQLHDELVYAVNEVESTEFAAELKSVMENSWQIHLPVNIKIGRNWGIMK